MPEGNLLPPHLDALRLTWRKVGGARDLDELRHVNLLFRSELDHYPARHDQETTTGQALSEG